MDEQSLFQPQMVSRSNLPRHDRRNFEGLTQFGPDDDGFMVFVTPSAVIALYEGTRQQVPLEAFGLLMGRVYEDKRGSFTIVSGVVYARGLKSGFNHVQLSHLEMHKLRQEATRIHPAADLVGWTHSHRDLSGYSSIDFREQKTWTEDYHVGILTFMDCIMGARENPWAVVYRGPLSRQLPLVVDATPLPKEIDKSSSPTPSGQEVHVSSSTGKKRLHQSLSERPWYIRGIVSLFLICLIVGAVALGVVLGNFISFRLQLTHPMFLSTNLLWDCDQQKGKAPLKVTCTGPVGPDVKGWVWDFGDGTKVQKSMVTHIYQKPGMYKIRLTIISSFMNQDVGFLNIEVVSSKAVADESG